MPQSSVPSRNARRAYAKIAQAPIERLVVIFERFFLHEPELTAELLGELARCDTAGRRRLSPTCPRWTRCTPTGPRADLCPPSLSTARHREGPPSCWAPCCKWESAGAEMGQQRLSDQPEAAEAAFRGGSPIAVARARQGQTNFSCCRLRQSSAAASWR
jgi:hypothetical protein